MAEDDSSGFSIGLMIPSFIFGGVLVYLRTQGHVDWAWKWVLAPFWMPFAIIGIILIGFLAFMGLILMKIALE